MTLLAATPLLFGTQGTPVTVATSGTFAGALVTLSTSGGGAGSTAVNLPTVSAAGFAPVTSSAGLVTNLSSGTVSLSSQITVTATGPVTVTSGTITLSSVHTVTATGPVTVTSGLISVTSGTITSTAGTNPWSSAPGFNIPVVSVSSGLVQLSSQITVTATGPVTVTSGLISVTSGTITSTSATNPWSSAPGFNMPVVTVSSGLVQVSGVPIVIVTTSAFSGVGLVTTAMGPVLVTSSGGPVFSAGVNTAAGIGPVTSSAGRLSSLSSGTVTLSSVHTVTATAGTNPWSSAPGFNVPVVSVSSGLVQISGVPTVGITSTLPATGKFVVATSISKVTSSATTLWGYVAFTTGPDGSVIRFYNAATGGVVMNTGVVAAIPVSAQSTIGGNWQSQVTFGPRGFNFATACSFDVVLNATSTLAVAGKCFVTAFVN